MLKTREMLKMLEIQRGHPQKKVLKTGEMLKMLKMLKPSGVSSFFWGGQYPHNF